MRQDFLKTYHNNQIVGIIMKQIIPFCILIMTLVGLTLASCQWLSNYGKGTDDTGIKIHRFDKLQEEYVNQNSFSALKKMSTGYPQEMRFLIEDVLALGAVSDDGINLRMREYYSDTLLQQLSRDALNKFSDMSQLEKEFTQGFRRLKKELPQIIVPRIYAQISALNQSIVIGDSILGFSIDKYMGADYPIYSYFYHPHQCRSMSPERIVTDSFIYYLLSEYPFPWEWHRSLLDHIIHQGKIHWVVAQILKHPTFETTIGYTPEEGAWCTNHREEMWNHLTQSGQLHSTDPMLIRIYLHPAECTYPFGKESPAETGLWLGIQIVDEYMKKNPETSIADLLRETNYRSILKNLKISY